MIDFPDDLIGTTPIRDMSREEIIEEILSVQRAMLLGQHEEEVKHHLIHFRTALTNHKFMHEAGLQSMPPMPKLGSRSIDTSTFGQIPGLGNYL